MPKMSNSTIPIFLKLFSKLFDKYLPNKSPTNVIKPLQKEKHKPASIIFIFSKNKANPMEKLSKLTPKAKGNNASNVMYLIPKSSCFRFNIELIDKNNNIIPIIKLVGIGIIIKLAKKAPKIGIKKCKILIIIIK